MEQKAADRKFWRQTVVNATLIGLWYLFSISITVYNKWMFTDEPDNPETIVFPFPLFTTCVHMLVQFCLASLVLYFMPDFRPTNGEVFDPTSQKPIMTRMFYLTRIGPCGAATSLDIGLGNMSFKFITLTFYTMCKSSVLGFVLLFAFIFKLEKPSWKLGGIITMMTVGVVMMVAGEAAFNLIGFLLIMSSAASSGFRWSLTQILLIRHPATSNPFSSIFFLAPVMFITLLVIAIPIEGFSGLAAAFSALVSAKGPILAPLILLFPGILAFCMTASEFALLQRTSVVTLSICGIFKEVLTISTASLVFGDQLTPINSVGLVVTIGTIGVYNYMKIKAMREGTRAQIHDSYEHGEYTPVAGLDDDDLESMVGDSPAEDGGLLEGRKRAATGSGLKPAGLMAKSLSVSTGGGGGRGLDSPTKTSPLKRPEDLE
ncbi:TPT-domain-containing protein [Microthyrium microscopicum]|uniref:TPT-domain-containing protein n=1 Tax=Microthyrium microscopicum TaxID=703497 RepID=A0A6A6U0M8_9PEZI|nr:TPT-domain-containing protein [Microthyrium microscopicum]